LDHDKKTIQNEIHSLKNEINKKKLLLKDIVEKLDSENNNKKIFDQLIDKFGKKINTLLLNEQTNKNTKDRIKQLDNWLQELEGDIEEMKSPITESDSYIENQTIELEDLKNDINKSRHILNLLDTVKFIVSEEGVKSYIVKKILLMFNDRIRYYLNQLDANCICNFNEYFEEVIINDRGQECSYFNFSGGERKRIDLSVLFMFQDIRRLQSDVSINLSMYDELFDSALDERGSECILSLLKERVDTNKESI
jgi:DNA repair exonuclease SbcCD ATPase subunit